MNRSDFVHFITLPIQWGDMDAVGHVNNVIYFRYLESGRVDYFRAVEMTPSSDFASGAGPILADIQCSFIGQLKYPATIEVATRTARLGSKSFEIKSAIFAAGSDTAAATSRSVGVWFDYVNQTTAPLPGDLRERIIAFEAVTPEGA